jgi:hypothetical protein
MYWAERVVDLTPAKKDICTVSSCSNEELMLGTVDISENTDLGEGFPAYSEWTPVENAST